jgi:hypothetical protein
VAEKVLKAIARNASIAPVTPEAWAMYLLKRLSPGLVFRLKRILSARFEQQLAARESGV